MALVALAWSGAATAAEPAPDRAEVRLEPDSGRVEGRATLRPTGGALVFRLAPELAIVEARAGGRPLPIEVRDGSWTVRAPAGTPVALRYAGKLPTVPTEDSPFLGPEGGFLPGGSGWLPETGADLELTLDVPEPHAAVATGRLAEEERAGGRYRARFLPEPGAAPVSAFVGTYAIAERWRDGVRLRTYFHPEDAPLADLYLARTAAYLGRFDRVIGPYPFSGFSIVAGPLPVGLGFPGLTYVARAILPLPFMQTRSLAHEILHSWWGGAVRVDYATGNWAEGLTTYLADYGLAEDEGEAAAAAMRLSWLRDFAALPPARDRPLRAFVARDHDAAQVVGYGKAAFVFHMLRREVGEDAFAAALRRFHAAHRFGRAGWDDLRASFEAEAGRDLGWFFAQWLERAGAPRLELAETARSADGRSVSLLLRQAEPTYRLAVPVTVETADGPVERAVVLAAREARAEIDAGDRALAVAVDPAHHLFRALAPGEAPPILRDVTLAEEVAVLVAGDEPEAAARARELAARLVDRPRFLTAPDELRAADIPRLVVGLAGAVDAALAAASLPPVPAALAGRGTARAWTAPDLPAPPLLAVAAEDAAALEALARPLPHHRRESFLVFEGGRVVERGTWPARGGALARRFE